MAVGGLAEAASLHRIGLIVDGTSIQKQYADLVDWARAQPDLEVTALIIQNVGHDGRSKLRRLIPLLREIGPYRLLSRIVFSALLRVERKLTAPAYLAELENREIGALVREHVHVTPNRSASGFVYRYSGEDLAKVQALKLDVLVRCGSGILRGEILKAAQHGVVSIHHGNNRINRGGPPGFWEVRHQQAETGFVVQRLTEELDGGEVLRRGSTATEPMFLRNQAVVYRRSTEQLQTAIRHLLDGRTEREDPHIYYHQLYRAPLLGDIVAYGFGVGAASLRRRTRRLLGTRDRWSVAVARADWRKAVLWRATEIPNPKGSFLADPFVYSRSDGRQFIFAEEYIYSRQTGVIAAYELDQSLRAKRLGIVLDEGDHHLSFPFVFEHEGELYMCPETRSRAEVRLYRCADFPLRWQLHSVLLKDVRAVDTILFPRAGKWWLLTNINNSGLGGASELHAFHSASPFGPWTAMVDNPVIVDALTARNGGLLRAGEDVFRVGQRPAFGTYGRGFSIFRVTRLDEEGYEEVKLQDIEPFFRKRLRGTHHMHENGGLIAFDLLR